MESEGGVQKIFAETPLPDGGVARQLLRETSAGVQPDRSGSDPLGRAAFATWDEDGQRWFAVRRGSEDAWSKARPLRQTLRLRDGAIAPGANMPAARHGLSLPSQGRLFIVQFRTVGLPEWRATLAEAGAEVLSYLPHNAHVVRVDPSRIAALGRLEFVERVEPYHPWYRIDNRLRAWLDGAYADNAEETQRVRVMAFEWGTAGKERIAAAARAFGAEVVENWPNGHVIELMLTRAQLKTIVEHDDVMWADPWTPPSNDMDLVRQDAGTDYVETNFGYCGDSGVRGEVLDSGFQDDHPDFDGIIFHGSYDTSSHGTSTYGIVFGNGDRDGDGQAQGTGHMPCAGAQGIAADYGFLGDRFAHTQELKDDPYWASFQTNSWGSSQIPNYSSVSQEMDDIIWRLDIAILQSQSNTGNQNSRPQAWAKNIIAVGGINHENTLAVGDDNWSGGGSIGPAEDGRIKPDVSYWYDSIYTTTTGSGYTSGFGGTSAATPESAGVLGLIVEMWADNVWGSDPFGNTVFEKQPHFSTMKALLINNSQQYDFTGPGHDLTRVHQGWGRPSAQLAKDRAATSFVVDEEVVLELNDFSIFNVDVQPGETELKVTMVYPDPPGTTSAAMHRINNVNLKVTSPSSTVYHGNVGLLDGTESVSGGAPNEIDTVENVFIQNPEAGTWVVEIEAVEINQDAHLDTPDDDVTYALVITGGTSTLEQPFEGRIRMDDDAYSCAATIGLRVIDGNAGAGPISVEISSDSETTPEVVMLTETKPGSGKYSGSIDTTSAAAAADGLLSVVHVDSITVDYIDVDDGAGGSNLLRQDAASADCQQPVISAVGEQNVSDVAATIVWDTDEDADSEIVWGETKPPTNSETGFGRVTDHQINLSGLQECTVYFYEVRSADRHGNLAVDDSGGSYYHFETLIDFGSGLQACHAGNVSLDAANYSCSDVVTIQVSDLDLNPDPLVAETVMLTVSSSTETEPETVLATETGPNTSTFTGTIATAGGAPASDGVLQASHGDVITATYRDEDDGAGAAGLSFATAIADCGGPALSNLRVEAISDQRATIAWDSAEPSDGVLEWGPTPALGNVESASALTTSHSFPLNQFDSCQTFYFRVQGTDVHGNTSVVDNGGQPFSFHTFDIPGLYYHIDFESGAPGWTLNGEWETGAPQGIGGSSGPADPSEAYNNGGVLGHDLSGQGASPGDYEALSNENALSPVFDGTAWSNTRLIYYRDLEAGNNDTASLWLITNGTGRPLFSTLDTSNSDNGYQAVGLDVGVFADGASTVQLEFRQSADASGQHAGWTVDDIIFKDGSLPDYAACQDCASAPSFAGATSAVDNDACGASGVTVSWDPAVAWGGGDGGTYAVYRDTAPGFTPSGANLVASGVAGLSYNDAAAPTDQTLYYLVRAENDESCGSGPQNGGLLDGNAVYVAVDETTTSPTADAVDGVTIDKINFVHLRLDWNAAPGATSYRIYRSDTPDGGFLLIDEVNGLSWDDLDQGGNANSFYYQIKGVNACGQEGP